jgi:flavin reductase (DIM6/NTAB) family NADH-FMN oxidoreductase RutF
MPDIGVRENAPDIRARFIDGMSRAATCVNVVTTDGAAGRFGVTVSAMSAISADGERPTVLVCVHHQSRSAPAIIENGAFCVNVLRDDQSSIADCFADRIRRDDGDKFGCASWVREITGAPRLADPLAAFDCRVLSAQRVGTHHIIIGAVEAVFISDSGAALMYADRAYGTTQRIETPASAPSADPISPPLQQGPLRMAHTRIRKFNTKDTYLDQNLDNDLCQAVVAQGSMVFVRGQVGQDLDSSKSVGIGDPSGQAEQAMANIKTLLEEAGAKLEHICKITIYIVDPRYREPVYRTVGKWLKGVFPVSTGLVVSALARPEWLVEIDAIAVTPAERERTA